MAGKLEPDFQKEVIKELKQLFKGCFVLKMDGSNVPQGFPDLLILYKNKWAMLECKKSADAPLRPNQGFYVDLLSKTVFSRFIFPENKEEVLHDLQQAFKSRR